jgi:hypothetical protein
MTRREFEDLQVGDFVKVETLPGYSFSRRLRWLGKTGIVIGKGSMGVTVIPLEFKTAGFEYESLEKMDVDSFFE